MEHKLVYNRGVLYVHRFLADDMARAIQDVLDADDAGRANPMRMPWSALTRP